MVSKSQSAAKQRPKKRPGPETVRQVDMSELMPLTQAISLKNIGTVRFAANALQPAYGVQEADVSQRLRFRATRMPQPDSAVLLSWIEFEYAASHGEEDVATVDGALALLYTVQRDENSHFTERQLDLVAEVNGLFNSWPYIRELISSSLARLGMPRLVLPTFRVPSMLPPRGEFSELTTGKWRDQAKKGG